jgi:hypothetical protein
METQKANSVAAKRLDLLKSMKFQLSALTEELAETEFDLDSAQSKLKEETLRREQLERLQAIRKEIKRERPLGRRGGGARWPVHIVLLICELLTVGNPPSAIPGTLQIAHDTFRGCELKELPTVDFVRKCRSVLENLNLMLAAKRLGEAASWHQLFTDGTTRRQIAFQNLVIGLLDAEDKFDSVIVSSCIFLENETSAKQVEGIKSKVRTKLNVLIFPNNSNTTYGDFHLNFILFYFFRRLSTCRTCSSDGGRLLSVNFRSFSTSYLSRRISPCRSSRMAASSPTPAILPSLPTLSLARRLTA